MSDWCNSAYTEEQNGDLSDLKGVPIEEARESSDTESDEATTIQTKWTFYTRELSNVPLSAECATCSVF